jgi:hypothetical protein
VYKNQQFPKTLVPELLDLLPKSRHGDIFKAASCLLQNRGLPLEQLIALTKTLRNSDIAIKKTQSLRDRRKYRVFKPVDVGDYIRIQYGNTITLG